MQIHELNGYSGALDDAYMAVDNGSDTGKKKIKDITDPLNARIDNIIAGPASSAQEVIDARLGADGVTYDSLGDAIRDQVTDLKDGINEMGRIAIATSFQFVQGSIYNGNLIPSTTDCITSERFFNCKAGKVIEVQGNATYKRRLSFFTANREFISQTSYDYTKSYKVPDNAYCFRLSLAVTGTSFTPSDYDGSVVVSEIIDLKDDVLCEVAKPTNFVQGSLYNGTLDSSDTTVITTSEFYEISNFHNTLYLNGNSNYRFRVSFFDAQRSFVSQNNYAPSLMYVVPQTAKFFRISIGLLSNGAFSPSSYDNSVIVRGAVIGEKLLEGIEDAKELAYNRFFASDMIQGSLYNGVLNPSNLAAISQKEFQKVTSSALSVFSKDNWDVRINFFDEHQQFLSQVDYNSISYFKNLAIPSGAVYYKVTLNGDPLGHTTTTPSDVENNLVYVGTAPSLPKCNKAEINEIKDLVGIFDFVPDYYKEELNSKIAQIHENMNETGKNGETFIFITDIHWENNSKHSPALINDIIKNTNIKTLVCGGDLINEGTKLSMENTMQECVSAFNFEKTFFPCAFGNHDDNKNNQSSMPERWFSAETVYALMYKQNDGDITYLTDNDWRAFYFDNPTTKTRFIFCDTGVDGWAGTIDTSTYGYWTYDPTDQLDQIVDCLKETESGWEVVLVAHWLRGSSSYTAFAQDLFKIADGINSRSALVDASGAHKVYDLSSAKAHVCAIFAGHTHFDYSAVTEDGIPIIITDCDNGVRSTNTDYPYVEGTITEQCFDVVTIDYAASTVKCVRIGRGANREFSY